MEGVQASGRRVEVAAMTWLRFEDGKIVEEWTYSRRMGRSGSARCEVSKRMAKCRLELERTDVPKTLASASTSHKTRNAA